MFTELLKYCSKSDVLRLVERESRAGYTKRRRREEGRQIEETYGASNKS
jgi:hypothetical protein